MTDTQSQEQAPAEDLRSELQKQEEADAAAYDRMSKAEKVAYKLDRLLEALKHQVEHNAPVSPSHIASLEDIRRLIG